jgi:hypothetical protein
MRNKKRLEIVECELRDLKRGYKDLLDARIDFRNDLNSTLDRELAQYRSAVQGTQTDRIKFDVLEEWINEVFKLNNLKFSQSDFIERSERDRIETEVREQIAKQIEGFIFENDEDASTFTVAYPRVQVALAKLVRETR